MKEERFPHWEVPSSPGQWQDRAGALEENTAAGFWRVSWRGTRTGGCRCCQTPQPEMLLCRGGRGLGAEIWASEVSWGLAVD